MNKEGSEGAVSGTDSGGKLGLALSGGGFRAAFFHIGVLAQMAMLGLLRHVEVISTVSGGSIVGALYYLHVKKLLEIKIDDEITDQDYKAIVERIEVDFLRGVQRNIRMRTFLNPLKNIRMGMANYSRSDRIGELYDELLYRPVLDTSRSTPIQMRELKIQPKAAKADFYPLKDNVGRRAKVPILLINATTLNTGHNWRFEASRMGEPPRKGDLAQDVDKNLRLLRAPSYGAIIEKQQDIELGLAVSASACVPGIFHPLAISDLYPDGIRVQLVDGGVHDNQGIQGLLDRKCTLFVVSDASGQMGDEPDPATTINSILGRTNGILMDRVREEELFRILQGSDLPVTFVHLRRGVPVKAVSWIGRDGEPVQEPKEERKPLPPSEDFGVAQEVQRRLSRIRTDLDSFTEVEAYSLMLDGYMMSEGELRKTRGIKDLIPAEATADAPQWRFLKVAPWMADPEKPYLWQLEVGGELLFKVFRLRRSVAVVTLLVAVGLLLGIWALLKEEIKALLSTPLTVGQLVTAAVVLALGFIPRLSRIFKVLRFLRSPTEFLVRFVTRALLPAIGSVFVWIHLCIFDPLFLRQGKIERLGPPPS